MTIQVTPNPDGTYEVTCGGERTTVGVPTGAIAITFPPISASGGGVAAHIINLAGLPKSTVKTYGLKVNSLDEIIADVHKSARHGKSFTLQQPAEYTLLGDGRIDIGKLDSALGGRSKTEEPLPIRIFIGSTDG
jgi:hypothetical protein